MVHFWVADYKTGQPRNLVNRNGDLADLQLAAYAETLDEPIGGLALINLDSRQIVYKGTGEGTHWHSERDGPWEERLAAWRGEVREALAALAAGDARLNLALSAADARPLAILSRIEERRHDG